MKPTQVWLPLIHGGRVARRDGQRALREWRGEQVVWVVPGFGETFRWREPGVKAVGIRGEQLGAFHVLHVGESGAIWGPGAAAFPDRSVSGLLTRWVNLAPVEFGPPLGEFSIEVPVRVEGGVAYEPRNFQTLSGSYLPITGSDEERQQMRLQWPPDPAEPAPVSPEEESAERMATDSGRSDVTTVSGGDSNPTVSVRALQRRIIWPEPFQQLFPLFSGLDDLYARDQMISIQQSAADPETALRRAHIESRDWISAGDSTVADTWLNPIIASEGEQSALSALETRYGLTAFSLEDGSQRAEWQETLRRQVPVRRVWGMIGLFWALLIDELEGGTKFNKCEACGRLNQGRSHKRFCSKEENLDCYRQRRAENRRRERRRSGNR